MSATLTANRFKALERHKPIKLTGGGSVCSFLPNYFYQLVESWSLGAASRDCIDLNKSRQHCSVLSQWSMEGNKTFVFVVKAEMNGKISKSNEKRFILRVSENGILLADILYAGE